MRHELKRRGASKRRLTKRFSCIRRASRLLKVISGTMGLVSDIDWENLQSCAFVASTHAYAPYSGYRVGAAALTMDGRVLTGCNVENVSLGLTLCAETVLVGNLFAAGGGRLRALVCCDATGAPLMPCGRCRQVLFEHGGPGLLVDSADGPLAMSQLLPHAFGPEQVAAGQLGSSRLGSPLLGSEDA